MSESPKTFWDDLNKDMEDPEFREAYAEASNEIAANVQNAERTPMTVYIVTAYKVGKRGWNEIHCEGGITESDLKDYATHEEFLDEWTDNAALKLRWRSGEYGARLHRQGEDTLAEGEPVAELEFSI